MLLNAENDLNTEDTDNTKVFRLFRDLLKLDELVNNFVFRNNKPQIFFAKAQQAKASRDCRDINHERKRDTRVAC